MPDVIVCEKCLKRIYGDTEPRIFSRPKVDLALVFRVVCPCSEVNECEQHPAALRMLLPKQLPEDCPYALEHLLRAQC